jgi:hypothetical protein
MPKVGCELFISYRYRAGSLHLHYHGISVLKLLLLLLKLMRVRNTEYIYMINDKQFFLFFRPDVVIIIATYYAGKMRTEPVFYSVRKHG